VIPRAVDGDLGKNFCGLELPDSSHPFSSRLLRTSYIFEYGTPDFFEMSAAVIEPVSSSER
jgi:prophage maintenance system killer protein